MARNNMPANWEPAYPCWESWWDDTSEPLVAGYYGIQAEQPDLLDRWASRAFYADHAPFAVEKGLHVGRDSARDYLYIAYWRWSEYRKWWALAAHSGWWSDGMRLAEGVGYWREIISMPFERFETLHTSKRPHGVGVSASSMNGPIREHANAGNMRDRIPLSDAHSLRRVTDIGTPLPARTSADGKRVTITPLQNMCVIRSGQNWSACEAGEKAFYLGKVHPTLLEAMHFLRDHPVETSCYSLRFVEEKDDAWGATEKSFGLGYALDVCALDDWAKIHPTHLAILGGFTEMVYTFGANIKLALWHEVTSLPKQNCEFEYIGCRPGTGLLGYI